MYPDAFYQVLEYMEWEYPKPELIFEKVKYIKADYTTIINCIGTKFEKKPTMAKLIKALKEIKTKESAKPIYEVINLNIENDEYYREALEATLRYHLICPPLLICLTDYDKYLSAIYGSSSLTYELALMWLEFKGYKHDLPIPEKINLPKLWKYCEREIKE